MHASPVHQRHAIRHLRCALTLLTAATLLSGCGSDDSGSGTETGAAANKAKEVSFLDTYAVKAEFPEGGAYDAVNGAFYFGSLKDGSVQRLDAATGKETTVFTETAKGTWWTLGMDVDVERDRLWVCAMDDRQPPPRAGFIWVIDTKTGKRIATHDLSKAAKDATCTDVAVSKAGTAYVVDREQPHVYKVDFESGATLFANDPALKGTLAGQNAVVILPDESYLLSVVYNPPTLVRVNLSDASVKKVALSGPFEDKKSLLAGADGMAYANGEAHVAFSGKLITVKPESADWAKATTTEVAVKEGMTDVIATPGGLYLLNGQAVRFALKQKPDPFALTRLK
ncbi:MAG: SMP-30/gluconolactonase/LRE family protein [Myxococcales bacterium]|nr:SMP-30/gluconolactonase/LRE family protein [Myxococcales bacterium]